MFKLPTKYKTKLDKIAFIDLFCGIGAFRLALESFGAECVFSSDIDKYARETYYNNFKEKPRGDITKIKVKNIPKHDMLCAGFPCQAFSCAGSRKGFEDIRGTLFFNVSKIIKYHKPKVVILENVEGLINHDYGKTFKIIKNILINLDYDINYKVLNASYYGVPQARKRIYIVCFRKDVKIKNFKFPKKTKIYKSIEDIKDSNLNIKHIKIYEKRFYKLKNKVILKDIFGNYPRKLINLGVKLSIDKGTKKLRKQRGMTCRIYSSFGHAVTQMAQDDSRGCHSGTYRFSNLVRTLTVRESMRCMGFPDKYNVHKKPSKAYKQAGNSIVVNVLQCIIKEIIKTKVFKGE